MCKYRVWLRSKKWELKKVSVVELPTYESVLHGRVDFTCTMMIKLILFIFFIHSTGQTQCSHGWTNRNRQSQGYLRDRCWWRIYTWIPGSVPTEMYVASLHQYAYLYTLFRFLFRRICLTIEAVTLKTSSLETLYGRKFTFQHSC